MDFASLLSGLGTAAGGLSSLFGSSSDGIDVSENYRLNNSLLDLEPKAWDMKVGGATAAARKYGYHPMYLMGGSSGYSPTVIGGAKQSRDVGGGLAALGQGAAGIAKGLTGQEKEIQRAQQTLGLRQGEAELRKTEMETALLASELKRAEQQANGHRSGGSTTQGPSTSMSIMDASGQAHPVTMPNLSEKLEPHYGEAGDLEAGVQYWKDRGKPMMKRWWENTEFVKDLTKLGAVLRARRHNNRKRNKELRDGYSTGGKF